jgi:uncharacterized membrane protein YfcA
VLTIGYISAAIIGVVLGLVGAGGSILAVPVLIYLFKVPVHTATIYSLFIVGVSSFFGTIGYVKNGLYSFKTIIFFGIPSVVSIYFTRTHIVHRLPDVLFTMGGSTITKDIGTMMLFAILMILASYSMIRKSTVIQQDNYKETKKFRYLFILILGLIVGFIAGLLGAGGGFMMIPALVVLANLPMKMAIGTSLTIICINSSIGFFGDLLYCTFPIDWHFLAIFTVISIIGILLGTQLSKYISGNKLRPAFGWFILVLGIIILSENFLNSH